MKHTACISLICCWCTGGAGECESGQVQEDGSWAGRRRRAGRHRRVCAHQDQDQEQRQLRQRLLLSECLSGQMLHHPSPAGVSNALLVCVCVCVWRRVTALPIPAWWGHPALWGQRAEVRRSLMTTRQSALSFPRTWIQSRNSWSIRIRDFLVFLIHHICLKNNCKHINLFITTSIYVLFSIICGIISMTLLSRNCNFDYSFVLVWFCKDWVFRLFCNVVQGIVHPQMNVFTLRPCIRFGEM